MAGRPREPIDLIKAKGKKNLSKSEYEERKSTELEIPDALRDVEPPSCLTTKAQREEFTDIASKLIELNIFTVLDVDALVRYIFSKENYLSYSKQLKSLLNCKGGDLKDIRTLQKLQDIAYRQCVTSANELCLNISSRAKLVIPPPAGDDDDEL